MGSKIDKDILRYSLDYDALSGIFKWKNTGNNKIKPGDYAGTIYTSHAGKKYLRIQLGKRIYMAHRLAWEYINGDIGDFQIDHKNGDGLDNRIENLRKVSNLENSRNQRKPKNNTSGIIGISWDKVMQKWHARIRAEGRNIHLGFYSDKDYAISVRKNAELKYGFHENHGSERSL